MAKKETVKYATEVVLRSPLTGHFYFCPKVKVIDGTTYEVVGRKFNVTASLMPYLQAKYRPK